MLSRLIEEIKGNGVIRRVIDIVGGVGLFLIVLVVILCIRGVYKGALDGTDILTITSTILGGYFSFMGGAIAVIGAYLVFYLQNEENNTTETTRQQKELNYKKMMLFNLLDYTILKTDDIYQKLNRFYVGAYVNGFQLPTEKGYENEIKGNLYNDCTRIYSLGDRDNVKQFQAILKDKFNGTYLREYHLYEHIYDSNWTSYLDCIPSLDKEHYIENIQRITAWITLLQNSKVEGVNFKQIDPIDFVLKRRGIDGVIDELAPEIKEKGFRSEYSMINQEIYRPGE